MESSYCFLCTTTVFRCLFCVCYCLWLWLRFYSKISSFLHCWEGGIKGKDFTGLVLSLKGDSHNIPALAISKDPGNGMRMDLAFPRRTEQICYSKCQLIYSRKLQRFQTVPIPEFPCQHPWFYSCASCVLLSALLQHVAPQWHHTKPVFSARTTLMWTTCKNYISLCRTKLPSSLQLGFQTVDSTLHWYIFMKAEEKSNFILFFLFLFNVLVHFSQLGAFGSSRALSIFS